MSRIFLAFIFCLLSLTPIKAEVLKDLVIEGNKRVSSETIKFMVESNYKKINSEKI